MSERKKLTIPDNFKIPVSVVFLGPPASGKGTTASYLNDNYEIKSVSPGNIFKKIRHENNELSNLVIETTKNGGLCPDWLTNELVKKESISLIESGAKSITLDGYPRTVDQLDYLLQNYDVKMFVHATANYMTLKKMVTNRRNCAECKKVFSVDLGIKCDDQNKVRCAKLSKDNWETRWDDTPEFFAKRYSVYKNETYPVVEVVKAFDNFFKLDLLKDKNYKFIESFLKLNS
jgi:adenylate kinase